MTVRGRRLHTVAGSILSPRPSTCCLSSRAMWAPMSPWKGRKGFCSTMTSGFITNARARQTSSSVDVVSSFLHLSGSPSAAPSAWSSAQIASWAPRSSRISRARSVSASVRSWSPRVRLSRRERWRNCASCPTCRMRRCAGTKTAPEFGKIWCAKRRSNVAFPEVCGPTTATIWPCRSSRSRPWKSGRPGPRAQQTPVSRSGSSSGPTPA
mmetsp:Transcript_2235/g.6548  ORF Transcript_2235/g.6548 Transcript_2235/m.6548 type:complete len:210 (+) Transcript_2235:170-799(+)